jgi:hypothetical protein
MQGLIRRIQNWKSFNLRIRMNLQGTLHKISKLTNYTDLIKPYLMIYRGCSRPIRA